jgi:hypothetical protein
MLFESNESLGVALKTLNKQQLTPIGCFIALNSTTQMLAKHEFSALLAMMEVDQSHSPSAVSALVNTLKQFYGANQATSSDSKVLLCAAYLQVPTAQLLNALNQ